jgi:hypothetical protein
MKNINSVILSRSAISQYLKNEGDYLPLSSSLTSSSDVTSCYGCNISFLRNILIFFSREKNLAKNLNLFKILEKNENPLVDERLTPGDIQQKKKWINTNIIKVLLDLVGKGGFNKNLEEKKRKAGVKLLVRACFIEENRKHVDYLFDYFIKQLGKLLEIKNKPNNSLSPKIINICMVLIDTVRFMKKLIFLNFVEGSGITFEGKILKYLAYLHKKLVLQLVKTFEEVLSIEVDINSDLIDSLLVPLLEFIQKEIGHSDLKDSMKKLMEGEGKERIDKSKVFS